MVLCGGAENVVKRDDVLSLPPRWKLPCWQSFLQLLGVCGLLGMMGYLINPAASLLFTGWHPCWLDDAPPFLTGDGKWIT
ncbi:hypothetical protein CSC3H3_13340 [Thalassospira marina]|uniref:Uncharacterized protein n=1 Tax=Thalassospira marina TaxID=2048283 RepID=A0ABM6QAP8_9PROT|nr:hypothetical protein CSC3H3_13340 [Thalassospira marina]